MVNLNQALPTSQREVITRPPSVTDALSNRRRAPLGTQSGKTNLEVTERLTMVLGHGIQRSLLDLHPPRWYLASTPVLLEVTTHSCDVR